MYTKDITQSAVFYTKRSSIDVMASNLVKETIGLIAMNYMLN